MAALRSTGASASSGRRPASSSTRAASRTQPAVLLGGGIVALSAARALGTHGVAVCVLGNAATDLVKHSRFCTSFVDLGIGDGVQERWSRWLSSSPLGEAVLFPCCDDGLELVARERGALTRQGYLPMEANDEVVLAMLDKLDSYALAQQAGVAVPRHFALDDLAHLDSALAESGVGFPCALKPLHSHLFARHYGGDQKVFLARDRDELKAAAARTAAHRLRMMVTEVIPGPEDSYHALHTYLDEHGEPLAQLTKRKLRQYPVGFGMGTYHVTDWNEEVARVGLQFCRGVGIVGVANPEFKRDSRDGQLKLIECNHRFTMSNELLRRAGVNLPLLAYDRLLGLPVHVHNGYRRAVYQWSPAQDLRAFAESRRRGQLSLLRWLRSLLHRRKYLTAVDRGDLAPLLVGLCSRARRMIARGSG